MTIKTLKPVWVVAARGKKANRVVHTFTRRREARKIVREYNLTFSEPGRLAKYYVARYVHRHFSDGDFTR